MSRQTKSTGALVQAQHLGLKVLCAFGLSFMTFVLLTQLLARFLG